MRNRGYEILRAALELLFPSRCVHCAAPGALLCPACLEHAVRLDGPVCRRCATPMGSGSLCGRCAESLPSLSRLIAVFRFEGAIRDAVHSLKYQDIRALVPVLAREMADDPRIARVEADSLVPVPLHRRRIRERGYNQAELLALELGMRIGLPVQTDIIERTVDTDAQTRMPDEQARAENVSRAFRASPEAAGRSLMLVDDVTTTGSTLNACAQALLDVGAQRVGAIVLAKDVKEV